jgi:putative hydrolase of the HAD superfamily
MTKINTLFLDIGGVFLTNGWDRSIREKAIRTFQLNKDEFNDLHKEYYDLHEQGKISLSTYLDKVVFWKKQDFSKFEFEEFMKNQAESYPEMIKWISDIKKEYNLKIVTVSNEGRELAEYRIKKFNLTSLIDTFIISSFVYFQKPDPRIYQIAFDVTQSEISKVLYIDDRAHLVEAASKLGIKGIVHKSHEETKKTFEALI